MMRQMKNSVMNYDEAEVRVREATSNDATPASSSLKSEVAEDTKHRYKYSSTFNMILKRLTDYQHLNHVFKSLVLVDYLIRYGDERFVSDMIERQNIIKRLRGYKYFKEEQEIGGVVRNEAKRLFDLLNDKDEIDRIRLEAQNLSTKIKGYSNRDSIPTSEREVAREPVRENPARSNNREAQRPSSALDSADVDMDFNFDDDAPVQQESRPSAPTSEKKKKKKKVKKPKPQVEEPPMDDDDFDIEPRPKTGSKKPSTANTSPVDNIDFFDETPSPEPEEVKADEQPNFFSFDNDDNEASPEPFTFEPVAQPTSQKKKADVVDWMSDQNSLFDSMASEPANEEAPADLWDLANLNLGAQQAQKQQAPKQSNKKPTLAELRSDISLNPEPVTRDDPFAFNNPEPSQQNSGDVFGFEPVAAKKTQRQQQQQPTAQIPEFSWD